MHFKHITTLVVCALLCLGHSRLSGQCTSYPSLRFQSAVKTSGTANAVGAVYKFTGVITGVDAFITILDRRNASVQTFDDDATAYIRAWQPTIKNTTSPSVPSWVKFRIDFKTTAGAVYTMPCLAMGVIDCDGASTYQERISTLNQSSYKASSATGVTFSSDSFFNVNGDNLNYNNIDTTAIDAMAQVNYTNVSSIIIKIGAIGTLSNTDRQNCLYFKNFGTLSTALPVSYSHFDVSNSGRNVNINWGTFTEHNNARFEIERSSDGKDFVKIGEVAGNGTSGSLNEYEYFDVAPEGVHYYRIKQVDYNDAFEYSVIKATAVGISKITNVSLVPNPASSDFNISFFAPSKEIVTATIVDAYGQVLQSAQLDVVKGENTNRMELGNLPSGLYFLEIKSKNDIITERIIKL